MLRSFIWPADLKAEPNGIQRFGRVVHWMWAAGAVALVAAAFGDRDEAGFILGLAASCWLVGRALRYIFSGE
jgi:hypothetical protein